MCPGTCCYCCGIRHPPSLRGGTGRDERGNTRTENKRWLRDDVIVHEKESGVSHIPGGTNHGFRQKCFHQGAFPGCRGYQSIQREREFSSERELRQLRRNRRIEQSSHKHQDYFRGNPVLVQLRARAHTHTLS